MSTSKPEEVSRAYTKEETRTMFLEQVRAHAQFWANLPDNTPLERSEGLVFALMAMFDGDVTGLPPFDIVTRPLPGSREAAIEDGRNYFEDGMVINDDCMLHEVCFQNQG
jgi:hypothetical protein